MPKIVCFGEVLWDIFPNGEKKIGGAPLNVALRLASFGNDVAMVSAIGKDENGQMLLNFLVENGLNTSFVQKKDKFSTGEVTVALNKKGSASYQIEHPRAWDKIELSDGLKETVASSDALVFGSLVTRDEVSKQTLLSLIDLAKYSVFDLNLRPPHYSKNMLIDLMNKANFIKFNDEELYEVAGYLNSEYNGLEQNLKFISKQTNTQHICVTKGEHGAVLLYDGQLYYNSGYQIKVKDTVGAGDSFLGTLISQLLNEIDPQKAVDIACGVGALVAKNEGANPKLSKSDIESFIYP
ncbi:carbohydrate kinase [Hyunsoonleella sp. SJ7]|uniref:Carbohydrate kinase n=1 Tax=Hyunsoonleella aquatilis TaxID=2762758 RepID=A0A923KMS4_9FLAO|nr:carbohydrate kinase [Hyunsoonleella aquatilis]MBC3759380.1 carbohydrate kinase [Hyunsoonleella aquatilis]